MTTETIDYDRLTDDEALDILKQDFDPLEVETWNERGQIISAPDVLYYADAYGDLEDAILLQGWDKSLPERVHKGLLESGYDIFEAVDCHDLESETCPCCDSEMWAFQLPTGRGYTHCEWIDSHGNVSDEYVEFVEDQANTVWNANPDDNHAPVLCPACSHDVHYDFPDRADHSGSVRIHYGETDEISAFSVSGNLVRWDFEAYMGDNMTDLFGLPGEHKGLPVAFATRSQSEWLDEHGWVEIAEATVKEAVKPTIRSYKVGPVYREIASEWAKGDETHPDLDFTYIIEFASFGHPSFLVAEENRDQLMDELTDLIERRL